MKVILYGNGAMAKVVFAYAKHKLDIQGFTVDDTCINGATFCNLPLIPFSQVEQQFTPHEYKMLIAMGFVDMNDLRARKYQAAKQKGYEFTTFVHDSVVIHDDVTIGENCVILDYVSIHPGSQIEQGTFISSNTNIGHDCFIDHSNWINSGVSIAGGCHIQAGCFFGVNASVGQGIRVGKQTFIAANTFINKDTQDNEVYLSEAGTRFKMSSKAFLKFSSAMQ